MVNHPKGALKGLSVVIPVYNENHSTTREVVDSLKSYEAEVIVVDDGSKFPYPEAIQHSTNLGYGAALMTGIERASNPVVMTIDGDGQHQVQDVLNLYTVWQMLNADMVVGARRLRYEKFIRVIGRKVLNLIATFFSCRYMEDLNSGMRIFKRKLAIDYSRILCRQFSFTTSLTMSMLCDNYHVEWFPINVKPRAFGSSKVRLIKHGLITLYYIIWIGTALRTRKLREWLRRLRDQRHHSEL